MQKTQQALARSRRASRREVAPNVDIQDSASDVENASTAQNAREHVDTQDIALDSASDVQNASTHDNDALHVDTENSALASASDVQSTSTAHEALARAREAQARALEIEKAARKALQEAERELKRLQRDAEQAAQEARQALYKIDVVTAGPLDGHRDLRQALLAGGTIALHAFQSAVESGTVVVRARKKTRVARTPSTTPRAPGRVMTADEIADILERSGRGETVADISAAHGLHPVTTRAILAGRIVAK